MYDHYNTLNVDPNANQSDIKRSYRRLALLYHPDKNIEHADKFKEITEAYEVLSDPERKEAYDKSHIIKRRFAFGNDNHLHTNMERENHYQQDRTITSINGINGVNGVNGVNVVNSANGYNTNFNNSTIQEPEPEDITTSIKVTMMDCYNGASIPIKVDRRIYNRYEKEVIYVDVPPGTDDGEVIVLTERGNVSKHKISNIRITVIVEPDSEYRRERLHIYKQVELSLLEALCGFTKHIEHLDGKCYRVSNERRGVVMQPNATKCITGRGFTRGNLKGNLYIEFKVVFPETLSEFQLSKIEQILREQ